MTLADSNSGAPEPAPEAAAISPRSLRSNLPNSGAPESGAPPIGKNSQAHRDGGFIPPIPFPLSLRGLGAARPTEAHRGAPGWFAAVAWTEADIATFLEYQSRLLRWGWSVVDAEQLADRLVQRDRGGDARRACVECRQYRPGRCGAFRVAGLRTADIGRDLAVLLQRCPGFSALTSRNPPALRSNTEDIAP